MSARPRVAVVHPYWSFWEHTADAGLRAARAALTRRVVAALEPGVEVVIAGELADPEAGAALAACLTAGPAGPATPAAPPAGPATRAAGPASGPGVDAVLVLQTMAVPPTHALAFLDALPRAGVVIWAAHEHGLPPTPEDHGATTAQGAAVDHGAITAQGATVGAPMLGNVLARRGRPFELVLGRVGDAACHARVTARLGAAAAAGGLRRARIGRVGPPLAGYLHVDLDPGALRQATGIEVVALPASEVRERYRDVPGDRLQSLVEEVTAGWDIDPDALGEPLERSLRVALALEALVADHRLDAGALNCHVPEIRFGSEIGVTPCFGLGRLTSAGIPWTCTGDLLTAVAMLVAKRLGGAALYHELETLDYATGEFVIANSGEHDLAWLAPGERPRLRRNGWFCGVDPRCGVCAGFGPPAGPATLVGFTPHPQARGGFRLVAARGALTARRFPETGTVNGAFRFRAQPAERAWERWAQAGVNHHSAATPGDLAAAVERVALHLGIGSVVV